MRNVQHIATSEKEIIDLTSFITQLFTNGLLDNDERKTLDYFNKTFRPTKSVYNHVKHLIHLAYEKFN